MKQTTLILFAALYCVSGYGQIKPQNMAPPTVFLSFIFKQLKGGWIKYKIDANIKDSIARTVLSHDMPCQVMTERLSQDWEMSDASISSFVNYVAGDTSNIILTNPEAGIVGYRMVIVGDSCKVFVYGFDNTDPKGWAKYNQSDTAFREEILVQPSTYHVTLTKKPAYTAGEIIEGYIEFESKPFYQKASDNIHAKELQFYMKGYFKTFDIKHSKGAENEPKWMLQ